MFDINHDGRIEPKELEAAMRRCGQNPSKLEIRHLMHVADRDGNGVITYDEFCHMVKGHERRSKFSVDQMREQFDLFDQNKDGYIDRQEMDRIVRELSLDDMFPTKLIEEIFLEADIDGDGRINFQEFVSAVN